MLKRNLMVLVIGGMLFGACSDATAPTGLQRASGPPANDECIMCPYSVEINGPSSVEQGTWRTWEAVSDAPGDATYDWTFNGNSVGPYNPIEIALNSSGTLRVDVRGPYGQAYANASMYVTVTQPPPPSCPSTPSACYIWQYWTPTQAQSGGYCQFGAYTNIPVTGETQIQWYWDYGYGVTPIQGANSLNVTLGPLPEVEFDLYVDIYTPGYPYRAVARYGIPVGATACE
jgi:hypothetical protein